MDDIIVEGFLKNQTEMVTGILSEFNGKVYAHIRILVPSAEEPDTWIRTKKGVSILAARFHEIAVGVDKLSQAAGSDVTIARIEKNRRQRIHIGLNTFKDNLYCYIRIYTQDNKNEWIPTNKGVSIPSTMVTKLKQLSDDMQELINENKLND